MKQVEDKERLLVEMECKWCGKETPDDSTFCESCGKALSDEPSGEQIEESADTSDDAPLNDTDEGPANADEEKSSNAVDEEPENALDEGRDAAGEKLSADEELPGAVAEDVAEEAVTKENLPEEAVSEGADAFEPWLSFGASADASSEFGAGEPAASIPDAFRRSKRDEPLVDPPTPPDQPRLGIGRTVIVATVAVLFAAAIILLTCVILMRVLGL